MLISCMVQHGWSLNCSPREAGVVVRWVTGERQLGQSPLACSTLGDGDPMHPWVVGSTDGCTWLWGASALPPCLAPLSPKPPASGAKAWSGVLLLQVEGTMPRTCGLAVTMPRMSWGGGGQRMMPRVSGLAEQCWGRLAQQDQCQGH